MEQRVSLITLGVLDLGRSRRFYEALGWGTDAKPDDDVVFFQTGGSILALWDRARLAEDSGVMDGGGWGGVTLAHNVRSPQEVDAIIAEARAAGATIPRSGAETFWGGYSGCSWTRTAIYGRSRTTRAGPCTTTGRSRSPPRVIVTGPESYSMSSRKPSTRCLSSLAAA